MDSEATWFDLECLNHNGGGGCFNVRKWSIVHAVVEWGPVDPLTLRFVCTRCGARRWRVHYRHAVNQGGNPMSGLVHHAQKYRYRFRHMHRYHGWPNVV